MTAPAWAASAGARALVFADHPGSGADGRVRIDGPDGHHLQRVRRLEIGERIVVADGVGGWYEASVVGVSDGVIDGERLGPDRIEPVNHPSIAIAFAPAKSDHGTEVVHQLVELGVERIVPILTRRGVVRWTGDRAAKAHERLQRVAREAAMQAHRARIPVVDAPVGIERLTGSPGLVLAEPGGSTVAHLAAPAGGEWLVMVGPEGGFTTEERTMFGPIPTLGIGAHVLRSVTAPVAVGAVLASQRAG